MTDVVLVHGLWHGGWAWDAVAAGLREQGVVVHAPDLAMRSLAGDVATVRAVLDAALDTATAPVLLVGHSYGGAVITAAGDHPAVARLVYLAAFALDETESISRVAVGQYDAAPYPAAQEMFVVDDDEVSMNAERAVEVLYPQCPAAATASLARVRPVSRGLFRERPGSVAWRQRPASYVVCADDRMVEPALQRVMAHRCSRDVREWSSDHSPQASHPDEVVALLLDLVDGWPR